jgi:predicted RNA binding protein with dsRBD fold (UPF0201 family)
MSLERWDVLLVQNMLERIALALEHQNQLVEASNEMQAESQRQQQEIVVLQKQSAESNERLSKIMEQEALADAIRQGPLS